MCGIKKDKSQENNLPKVYLRPLMIGCTLVTQLACQGVEAPYIQMYAQLKQMYTFMAVVLGFSNHYFTPVVSQSANILLVTIFYHNSSSVIKVFTPAKYWTIVSLWMNKRKTSIQNGCLAFAIKKMIDEYLAVSATPAAWNKLQPSLRLAPNYLGMLPF